MISKNTLNINDNEFNVTIKCINVEPSFDDIRGFLFNKQLINMKKEVVLTVRVAPEIKDIIDSIAQKDDRTVAWITRSLITEALQARKLLNWFLLTTTRQPKKLIPYSCAESPGSLRIEKYRKSRYWSVWVGQELLAVTVYKKGAVAIKNILSCEGVGEV